ncbi:NAD(P)/FAD-dependent oxidoreductase [Paucilactobacillus wasatchensis]|uniref:Glycine/D-amino acid oxidases family n=1 Tax=Paucilactobacillus wasatchensis TaxID=1335616 RepID=A0A0D0YXT5_9LACO|nr:FAD-dependent oxidoreductase [Paucilactobacillus wasatchensis]KIS04019.1 Glycine/D-amino acid oxidases family [Paucilactobacillus wasatchensis]
MTKIAIIGAGIVGATTAFFLDQKADNQITIFDEPRGQATSAAAGIISPWLSKRRNQNWYRLANVGAALYPQLVNMAQLDEQAYASVGTLVTRTTLTKLEDLWQLAQSRSTAAPQMGHVEQWSQQQIEARLPFLKADQFNGGVFVSGGARVDGKHLVTQLLAHTKASLVQQKARIAQRQTQILVNQESFDKIVIASGAGAANLVRQLGLNLLVRPQKGQLIEVADQHLAIKKNMPVIMPEGERDLIACGPHRLMIGATHENDQAFDLTVSNAVIDDLLSSGQNVIEGLTKSMITNVRVGTRAYTNDFAPFFGKLTGFSNIWIASGLGSSGLTTGPAIGKMLAQDVNDEPVDYPSFSLPVSNYLSSSARNA